VEFAYGRRFMLLLGGYYAGLRKQWSRKKQSGTKAQEKEAVKACVRIHFDYCGILRRRGVCRRFI
jgi:hypothetical protein